MARPADLIHLISATAFVSSGAVMATLSRPAPPTPLPIAFEALTYDMVGPGPEIPLPDLVRLYVQPQNAVMWALLVVLWLLVLVDAIGRYLEPGDASRTGAPLSVALLSGAVWPWLQDASPLAGAGGALLMLGASLVAAIRAQGQRRPGPGFMAGWSLTLSLGAIAMLISTPLGLSTAQTAVVAMLPSALLGMAAQGRLGRSIAFAVAVIWAFCAVAVTTMGTGSGVALAAIIGTSGMGVALVRAAT